MPDPAAPDLVFDGPADAALTIALAHGAGAPMDAPFMAAFAAGLAERGHRVARFEFPYMAARRREGRKKPPDRAPVLLATWRAVIAAVGRERIVVGGKSMGGRMASLVAAALEAEGAPVRGVVALGYPFHPPGRLDRVRIEHLRALRTPTLILQGERDPFGTRDEVDGYGLSGSVRVEWLADGDHGFTPRRRSGRREAQNWNDAVAAIDRFLRAL